MALPTEKARYTFADCLTWGENERIEIINGEAVAESVFAWNQIDLNYRLRYLGIVVTDDESMIK